MIVLNLELDGIYGFDDFKINFTYPKRLLIQLLMMSILMVENDLDIKKLLS